VKNNQILDFFKKAVEKGKLAHGYLFWGPVLPAGRQVSEMKDVAFRLADFLKTSPFDILYIIPEQGKKDISIAQIRNIRRHLSLSPYNSLYKFVIIDKAETMNLEASNALLKTLEEPYGNTILILISSKPDLLPKTIASRLQEVKFKDIPLDKIAKNFIQSEYTEILKKPLNDIFKFIEKICKASLAARFDESKTRRESRQEESEVVPVLDSWLFWFREKMIHPPSHKATEDKYAKIVKEIKKTKDLILTTNINQRLALENLVLCIKS
jgi:DNA polymerase III delta prime subunit